jgi:phospholipase C
MASKLTFVTFALTLLLSSFLIGCAGTGGSTNASGGGGNGGGGNPAAPVIASIAPKSATAGTHVTITGTGFGATQGSSTIMFNGVAATAASWSDTRIDVPVPAGATSGNVVITVAGLASNPFSFTVAADITAINHVIVMLQENRSFDSYFGQMTPYRQLHAIPIVTSNGDGKIDDLTSGNFSNSGIAPYHSGSVCMENLSPDWAEDRHEVNLGNASGINPTGTDGSLLPASMAPMNGFVNTAAGIAKFYQFQDLAGKRAMGYYTDRELNYYYFMASQFAMSDRFYSPAPTNSPNNHMYLYGATSQGTVHTPGGPESCPNAPVQAVPKPQPDLPNAGKPIIRLLDENKISWKIYITDLIPSCDPKNGTFPLDCAVKSSYMQFFSYINTATPGVLNPAVLSRMAPIDCSNGLNVLPPTPAHPAYACPPGVTDYFTDVKNGTLPAVAFIETGGFSGRDEHPSGRNLGSSKVGCFGITGQTCIDIQVGALFSSTIINALMNSPSWKDSVFIWTMDEGGGAFDHVPPMQVPNPDGIKPILCAIGGGTIASISVTNGGSGYTSAPTVTITDSTGTGATATAVLTGDVVTAINVTAAGANYTAPNVTLTGGNGSGATATATVSTGDNKDVNVGGDFNITGFRIPNMIISPFARKNYVSHTPMDYTAILKLIETRWGLPNLTRRDKFMPDMTEFFDFGNPPWAAPPAPPAQAHNTPCDFSLQ